MTKPFNLYPAVTKRKETLFSASSESRSERGSSNNGEVSESSSPAAAMIKPPRNVGLLLAEVSKPTAGKRLLGMGLV